MRLDVYAERAGEREIVGCIETVRAAGEQFTYAPEWLSSRKEPLSFSLPLQAELFPAKKTRPYFDGLLPEGAARDALAKAVHASPRSYVKLLAALGDECIGAVSFRLPDEGREEEREEAYVPLSEGDLETLAGRSYRSTTAINRLLDSLARDVPDAVAEAARKLSDAGYGAATAMGDRVAEGVEVRAKAVG